MQKVRKKKYSLWVEPGLTGSALRSMFKDVYKIVHKHENKSHGNFYLKKGKEYMKSSSFKKKRNGKNEK